MNCDDHNVVVKVNVEEDSRGSFRITLVAVTLRKKTSEVTKWQ